MNKMIIGIVLILCLFAGTTFPMSVPSQDTGNNGNTEIQGGGAVSDKELILIIVGAVCGTVILLALIK